MANCYQVDSRNARGIESKVGAWIEQQILTNPCRGSGGEICGV